MSAALSTVQPLPFVLVDDNGAFRVNSDAFAILEKVKTRLVAVAVLYCTGKSFLLNLLVQHLQVVSGPRTASQETKKTGM